MSNPLTLEQFLTILHSTPSNAVLHYRASPQKICHTAKYGGCNLVSGSLDSFQVIQLIADMSVARSITQLIEDLEPYNAINPNAPVVLCNGTGVYDAKLVLQIESRSYSEPNSAALRFHEVIAHANKKKIFSNRDFCELLKPLENLGCASFTFIEDTWYWNMPDNLPEYSFRSVDELFNVSVHGNWTIYRSKLSTKVLRHHYSRMVTPRQLLDDNPHIDDDGGRIRTVKYMDGSQIIYRVLPDGTLDGLYQVFRPDGTLCVDSHMKNGKLYGPYTALLSDGRKIQVGFDGWSINTPFICENSDGTIFAEAERVNGKFVVRKGTLLDQTGPSLTVENKEGNRTIKRVYFSGQYFYEETEYVDEKVIRKCKCYIGGFRYTTTETVDEFSDPLGHVTARSIHEGEGLIRVPILDDDCLTKAKVTVSTEGNLTVTTIIDKTGTRFMMRHLPNGKRHGLQEVISSSFYQEFMYRNGYLDGIFKTSAFGDITELCYYTNGIVNGPKNLAQAIRYAYTGKLSSSIRQEDDITVRTTVDEYGWTHVERTKNGVRYGVYELFRPDDTLYSTIEFHNDEIHGAVVKIADDRKKTITTYVHNQPEGSHVEYDENGKVIRSGVYRCNTLILDPLTPLVVVDLKDKEYHQVVFTVEDTVGPMKSVLITPCKSPSRFIASYCGHHLVIENAARLKILVGTLPSLENIDALYSQPSVEDCVVARQLGYKIVEVNV